MLLVLCLLINVFMTFYFDKKHWKAVRILHAVVFPILCFFYILSLTDPDIIEFLTELLGEDFYVELHLLVSEGESQIIPYFAIVFSSLVMFLCFGALTTKEIVVSCRNDQSRLHKNPAPLEEIVVDDVFADGGTKVYIRLCRDFLN